MSYEKLLDLRRQRAQEHLEIFRIEQGGREEEEDEGRRESDDMSEWGGRQLENITMKSQRQ